MGPFVDSKAVDSEVSGAELLNLWRVDRENSTNNKILDYMQKMWKWVLIFVKGCIAFFKFYPKNCKIKIILQVDYTLENKQLMSVISRLRNTITMFDDSNLIVNLAVCS